MHDVAPPLLVVVGGALLGLLCVCECVCDLIQLNTLSWTTFRTSETSNGGRSFPVHFLPAEESKHGQG